MRSGRRGKHVAQFGLFIDVAVESRKITRMTECIRVMLEVCSYQKLPQSVTVANMQVSEAGLSVHGMPLRSISLKKSKNL